MIRSFLNMNMRNLLIIIVCSGAASLSLVSCCNPVANAHSKLESDSVGKDSLVVFYNQAVRNSSYTASSKIVNDLVIIGDANPALITKTMGGDKYVMCITWKGYIVPFLDSATKQPKASIVTNPKSQIWVTVAPELKTKVKGVDSAHINMRLLQMLGLPPYATYSYFVEFWVREKDLFRPCPDKEITDNSCGLDFPADCDSLHKLWINEQRISRFFTTDTAWRFPWTELGYTYDWNPGNYKHEGCSEFVIKNNSTVYINGIYPTNEYIYRH